MIVKTIKNIVLSLLTVLMITSLLTYNVNAANNDSTNNNDQVQKLAIFLFFLYHESFHFSIAEQI